MRIRVDEIPDSGRLLHFHWDQSHLAQFLPADDPFEIRLPRPVNVDLELQRFPDHVQVTGKIKGMLQMACHRCLAPCSVEIDESIDISMIHEAAPADDDVELDLDEPDYDFYDGEVIDIDALVVEQMFLSLPVKVLCSEDCRGLCSKCGANLNEEQCRCTKEDTSPVFRKLEALKHKLPPSND